MTKFMLKKQQSRGVAKRWQQSLFWADFKSKSGWTPHFFEVSFEDRTFEVTVMTRKIAKCFTLAYVPMAAERDFFKNDGDFARFFRDFSREIKPFLPSNTILVRFDPPVDRDSGWENISALKKSSNDIQPPDTVVLDLSSAEEELLAAMKPKWRYNIRLAEKKGVKITVHGKEALDDFYRLFKTTGERDGIAIHSKVYFERLFQTAAQYPDVTVRIYQADLEDEKLAAIITLFLGDQAVYLYGASSNSKRNLMPTYLVQWQAICDAKKFGCKEYDFYGIPPTDDENHPMHGLYRFKTGFGGAIIHRIGSFDYSYSTMAELFFLAERLRSFYYKKIKKILR